MEANPLAFLVGGMFLLVSTITVALLNRRATRVDNPYDEPEHSLDLGHVLWGIRHADALYHRGLEIGRKAPPQVTPEQIADVIQQAGLGQCKVHRTTRRIEWRVQDGPFKGAPSVDEPLCYFTLGVIRGATGNARISEEVCHGTGAPECVFSMEVKTGGR